MKVNSNSMYPEYSEGQYIVIRKFLFPPSKDEILGKDIVFKDNSPNQKFLLKKCFAVSGDTVRFSNSGIQSNHEIISSLQLLNEFRLEFRSLKAKLDFMNHCKAYSNLSGKRLLYFGDIKTLLNLTNDPSLTFIGNKVYYPHYLDSLYDGAFFVIPTPIDKAKTLSAKNSDERCNNREFSFFALGINLNQSNDSRHYGPVRSSRLVGKVIFKLPL